jgi:glycopeptide antibiotics resistance protein
LSGAVSPQAALWLAVVASGVYHGLNPAMGWPLAVSNALMQRRAQALLVALLYLAAGHVLAILLMMLPFAMLASVLAWQRQMQIGASVLVIGFGFVLLMRRRHPRVLARIPPSRLALWSFAVAIAHGAGLMLVPIYLGLCRADDLDSAHQAAQTLIETSLRMALSVSAVHAAAMTTAGGVLAWLVYRYLGLRFVSRSWFNLDAVWASSLILVGGVSLALNAAAAGLSG